MCQTLQNILTLWQWTPWHVRYLITNRDGLQKHNKQKRWERKITLPYNIRRQERVKAWNVSNYHLPRFSELRSKKQYLVLLSEKGPRILNGNLDRENRLVSYGFHVSSWSPQTASHLPVEESETRRCGIRIPPPALRASAGDGLRRALQEKEKPLIPKCLMHAHLAAGRQRAATFPSCRDSVKG